MSGDENLLEKLLKVKECGLCGVKPDIKIQELKLNFKLTAKHYCKPMNGTIKVQKVYGKV
jgi:hypothetical protein